MDVAQPLPSNPAAERGVLGAILLDNHALASALAVLRPEDFFIEQHRRLYVAMVSMAERQKPIDLLTLANELERGGEFESSGGAAYIAQLVDGVPRISNVEQYAHIVKEKAMLRSVIHATEAIQLEALDGEQSPEEIAARAQSLISKIASGRAAGTVWDEAENLESFLGSGEDGAEFLDERKRIIARSSITEIFSPRGLGKSVYMLSLAIQLAERGLRVLVMDRDNPRHVVRSRLKSFGAHGGIPTLKVITREKCPPLTDTVAWARFPYSDHDVVILDSLDSAAEGTGEQDSAKPSRAIAPLLDIARRENGPAVLVLGNCVKTGEHSRGSGVIEDRADVVFEVRDLTGFRPTGTKPWFEELPPAGAGAWASRASRRKERSVFRLGFISSKFRIGEEPEPFVVELDLTSEPWRATDVTREVDSEGVAAREQRARERADTFAKAAAALSAEIVRRASTDEAPVLKDKDAIPFLVGMGLKRSDAREVVANPNGGWILAPIKGQKGHPIALLPPPKKVDGSGNTPHPNTAKTGGIVDADFRRAHPERAAGIEPSKPQSFRNGQKPVISAEPSLFTPAVAKSVVEGDL